MEEWKLTHNSAYEVSNRGRVRRILPWIAGINSRREGGMRKVDYGRSGYRMITLFENGRRYRVTIAGLVAEAFIGPRPAGYQINHKDGNKENNTPANLEYVTPKENMAHAISTGLRPCGARHWLAKLHKGKVITARVLHSRGFSYPELGRLFGVDRSTIRSAIIGETWST